MNDLNNIEDFSKSMALLSNEELLKIINIEPFNYQPLAVKAAEKELAARKLTGIKDLEENLTTKYFQNLDGYTDDDIIDLIFKYKYEEKKSIEEIRHILKMGKVSTKKIERLLKKIVFIENQDLKDNAVRFIIEGLVYCLIGFFLIYKSSEDVWHPMDIFLVISIFYGIRSIYIGFKNMR